MAEDIVRSGGRAVALSMDVTNEEAVNAGIADTVSRFGSIDVLVSNAGIQIVNRIEDYAFSDWRKMMAIHLDGAFLTTKAAVRHMYASGKGGAVIYMGSVHSHEASQLKSAYVTAEHGLSWACPWLSRRKAARTACARMSCARVSSERRWWTSRFRSRRKCSEFQRRRS